jgi:S-adenosylmethionine-diacylgycerolhomoserine-N-methlytransferase
MPEPADEAAFALPTLERFYAWQSHFYDWTRPFLLFGRERALHGLQPARGQLLLDVGCGTGFGLLRLAATGAHVIGVEPTNAMRQRCQARVQRAGCHTVTLDARPYGSHDDYRGRLDGALFSYSLSMIPPFEQVLERVLVDLRPGGRIAVVDFLDAHPPVSTALRRSHVFLGGARLDALRARFPGHVCRVRSAGLWRFFEFVAERE